MGIGRACWRSPLSDGQSRDEKNNCMGRGSESALDMETPTAAHVSLEGEREQEKRGIREIYGRMAGSRGG